MYTTDDAGTADDCNSTPSSFELDRPYVGDTLVLGTRHYSSCRIRETHFFLLTVDLCLVMAMVTDVP
ncbi:hypothetical protein QTP88_022386 [Uroleucon formosanum]